MANSTKQKLITREGFEVPWTGSDRRISKSSGRSGRTKFWSPRLQRLMYAESYNEHLFLYWLESKYEQISYYDSQPRSFLLDGRRYTPDAGIVTSNGLSTLFEIKDVGFEESEDWNERFYSLQVLVKEQGFENLQLVKINKKDSLYQSLIGLYQNLKFFDLEFTKGLPKGFKGTVRTLWDKHGDTLSLHRIYASIYYGFIQSNQDSNIDLNTPISIDEGIASFKEGDGRELSN